MARVDGVTSLSQSAFAGRIGIARGDITPPVGIRMKVWGSAKKSVAEGVHLPLTATAWVFQDSNRKIELVLVCADLMIFWQEEAVRIRNLLLDELAIPAERLILHPSHSHSTPMLARRHSDLEGGKLIRPYLDALPGKLLETIASARENTRDAVLEWAYGKCGLAYNRDFRDSSSRKEVCGLNLGAEADDTLLVGRATDGKDNVIGTLINYACHPVSMGGANMLLSPDYPGVMRGVVEAEVGGLCTFMNGASGDTTPRRSYEGTVSAAEHNGKELGYSVLSVLSGMLPAGKVLEFKGIEESGAALGIWQLADADEPDTRLGAEVVTTCLPIGPNLPTREEILDQLKLVTEVYAVERLERDLARRNLVGDSTEGDFSVTIWRIGRACLIASAAEAYNEFQAELRRRLAGRPVAVLNACDGSMGYLPSDQAYERSVYQVKTAIFGPGCLGRVIDAVSDRCRAETER